MGLFIILFPVLVSRLIVDEFPAELCACPAVTEITVILQEPAMTKW